MSLFSILFKLGVDGSQFETGLKRAQSAGTSFAKDFKKEVGATLAGMFAVDKVVEYGKKAVDLAGHLTDLSNKLGVSASFLQEMSYAAELGGGSLDDVSSALEKLSIARAKALGGDSGTLDAFAKLGVSADMLRKSRLEDIFAKIGNAFENGINPQPLLGALREIAGKGATSLVPAMADGLGEAAEKARELGMVMQDDVVSSLDDVGDRLTMMNKTATSLIGRITAAAAGGTLQFFESLGAVFSTAFNLAKDPKANPERNPLKRAGFFFDQLGQSFMASWAEQNQAEADAAEKRKNTAAMRARLGAADAVSTLATTPGNAGTPFSGPSFNLGTAQDPLAKIGGFTSFGASQDRVIQNLQEQVRQLSYIVRNTDETNRRLQ